MSESDTIDNDLVNEYEVIDMFNFMALCKWLNSIKLYHIT